MRIGIDPKVDYAFKRLFGHSKNGLLLCSLLNAILQWPPGRQIVVAIVLNPFIVQETGREPAKLEIEVQVLVKGPFFSSRGEITIMRRFERRVAGGSPAVRSTPRGREAQASAF